MSKILWLLLVLLLPGCEVGEGNTNEEKVKSARVELLFEHEGCRVYYARPKGVSSSFTRTVLVAPTGKLQIRQIKMSGEQTFSHNQQY